MLARFLITATLFWAFFPASVFAACSVSFSLAGEPLMDPPAFRDFIDKHIRPLLKDTGGDGFVDLIAKADCGGNPLTARMHMQKANYYILAINGQTLTKEQYTYRTSDVVVNRDALADAIVKSQTIASASDVEINNWVKIFAYFFAESARFSQVEDEANMMITQQQCGINWIESVTLLRHWGATSRFAVSIGQTGDMIYNSQHTLGSPVPEQIVLAFNHAALSNGADPNYQFIAERDRGHSIEVGATTCGLPLKPKGFLQMILYRWNVSIPAATDDGM
ncbi:hypothetical protein QBK93_11120 [Rhizobium leguminosarum]|uniref:hypothetical protein n=1 Tax=Rhizobium leguminosarum TaxID=384 RepID=UPI0024A7EB78|nr:hypothetical protein [Rhizobium leguminosarum]MDI5925224.1 hypothetical protein [Rhizobium leguminosarum]